MTGFTCLSPLEDSHMHAKSLLASSVAQTVKCLPAMQEALVWFLGGEHPLEKGMETPLQYSCLENPIDRGDNTQGCIESEATKRLTLSVLFHFSHAWPFATQWAAVILCHPLLLMPSIFPSIRVFSNESVLHIMAKVLELQLQHQSIQRIFRTVFL